MNPKKLPIHNVSILSIGFVYCFLPFFLLFQVALFNGVEDYDFRLPLGIFIAHLDFRYWRILCRKNDGKKSIICQN